MTKITHDQARLRGWLLEQRDAQCTRIVLRQKSDTSQDQVRAWSLAANTDVDALADEIEERAEDDGRFLRGPTLYGVFAYRDDDKAYVDRKFLYIEGQSANLENVRETEPANVTGITSQLMRHSEVSARLAVGTTANVIDHYKAMLAAAHQRIGELEARYFKVLEMYEGLTSMQHQRDLELLRAQQADKRQDFLKEKLDMLVPVAMSKLLGQKNGALGEELLRQFLKSLTPSQQEGMFQILGPEQMALIGEIFVKYAEKDLARDAKANGAANGHTNGHASGQTNGHANGGPRS